MFRVTVFITQKSSVCPACFKRIHVSAHARFMTSLLLWSGVQLVCCPWELESGDEQDTEVSIMPQIRLEYCYTELPVTTNTHLPLVSGPTLLPLVPMPHPLLVSCPDHTPRGERRSGERSRISWAYYRNVVRTNEIARLLIIT